MQKKIVEKRERNGGGPISGATLIMARQARAFLVLITRATLFLAVSTLFLGKYCYKIEKKFF